MTKELRRQSICFTIPLPCALVVCCCHSISAMCRCTSVSLDTQHAHSICFVSILSVHLLRIAICKSSCCFVFHSMGETAETSAFSICDSCEHEANDGYAEEDIWKNSQNITQIRHRAWARYLDPYTKQKWLSCIKEPKLWCYESEIRFWQSNSRGDEFFLFQGEWQFVSNASA